MKCNKTKNDKFIIVNMCGNELKEEEIKELK